MSAILTNQTFSFARYRAYLAAYYNCNRKRLLLSWGLLFIACMLFAVLPAIATGPQEGNVMYPPSLFNDVEEETIAFLAIFIIFSSLCGSQMYSAVSSRNDRSTTLTLPVSDAEKFWVYFTVYVVGYFAAFYISAWVTDLIRVAAMKMIYAEPGVLNHIDAAGLFGFHVPQPEGYAINQMGTSIGVYGLTLILISTFALGTLLWERYSYVKTCCALALLLTALGWIAYGGFKLWLSGDDISARCSIESQDTRLVIAAVLFAAISAGIFALGYRRMKEVETIYRW